jgi:hypothetical protein
MNYQLKIMLRLVAISIIILNSCIDENITNISDSLDINSCYSFPIGDVTYSINNYFESLDTLGIDTLQVDSLIVSSTDSVEFNGMYFHNIEPVYDTTIFSEFDFSVLDEYIDNVVAITIVLVVSSDFPTEILIQVYFTDETQVIMDSMYVEGPLIIPAPDLDSNGRPLERQTAIRYCPLSEDLIDNLTDIRYILAYGAVRTIRPDEGVVKFYPEYMLNIHIGARVELEFSTSEL